MANYRGRGQLRADRTRQPPQPGGYGRSFVAQQVIGYCYNNRVSGVWPGLTSSPGPGGFGPGADRERVGMGGLESGGSEVVGSRPRSRRERAVGVPGEEAPVARRDRRVNLAFNDAELALVRVAAEAVGMATGAWASRVVVEVARGVVVPVPVDDRGRFRELAETRVALGRVGTLLNQIAAAVNTAAVAGEDVQAAVTSVQVAAVFARVEAAVQRVDAATVAVLQR